MTKRIHVLEVLTMLNQKLLQYQNILFLSFLVYVRVGHNLKLLDNFSTKDRLNKQVESKHKHDFPAAIQA